MNLIMLFHALKSSMVLQYTRIKIFQNNNDNLQNLSWFVNLILFPRSSCWLCPVVLDFSPFLPQATLYSALEYLHTSFLLPGYSFSSLFKQWLFFHSCSLALLLMLQWDRSLHELSVYDISSHLLFFLISTTITTISHLLPPKC